MIGRLRAAPEERLEPLPPGARFRPQGLDVLLSLLLGASTFLVHDVGYLLRTPFWLDETWVAISTHLPVADVGRVTASSPVGWTLLLRADAFGGEQHARMVPLLFSAATVVAAYWLVFLIDWPTDQLARVGAVAAAVAVLLAPSSLVRNDLKQYTADAFFAVVVLALASGVERDWSRYRLIRLALVIVVGFGFSVAAGLVGLAAGTAFAIVLLTRRDRVRLTEFGVVAGAVSILLALIYLLAYRPGLPKGLNDYWSAYFLPDGHGGESVSDFLIRRATEMAHYAGLGNLVLALALVIAGVVTCLWLRQPVVALCLPILVTEMVVLAGLRRYPLFDERTSHFLTVVVVVYAAIGVVGICHAVRWLHPTVSALVLLAAVVLVIAQAAPHVRSHSIPAEDLRTPTRFVAAHAKPGDLVLVSSLSSWGVAYYWPDASPSIEKNPNNMQRFVAVLPVNPDRPRMRVAADRTAPAVLAAVTQAMSERDGGTVWIIRDHVNADEQKAWQQAFATAGIDPTPVLGSRLLEFTA